MTGPGSRLAGVAAALAAAVAVAGIAVVAAAPGRAASGLFLYKDGETGLLTPLWSPPNDKCFDVFKASEARNLTDSSVILFGDGLCSEVLLTLKPGESLNLTFNSFGFIPADEEANPPPVRLPS